MGNRLNIPVLVERRLSDGVTEKGSSAGDWLRRSKVVGGESRQIRSPVNAENRWGGAWPRKLSVTILPRKTSKRADQLTVPQTDTRGRGENPKALERTVVKELGKMVP